MADTLRDFLKSVTSMQFATDAGTDAHAKMRRIIIDQDTEQGDPVIITKIKSNPELLPLFGKAARTEIPIAGKVNDKFVSRRIDRMLVNDVEKSVTFIDYKTDLDRNALHDKYVFQMREYAALLRDIYLGYSIHGIILWLRDFETEEIC